MAARVLVLGLDGAEATLLEDRVADGRLPHLARLFRSSATVDLDDPHDTCPGAIWPEINSGISLARLGHYFTQDQLHSGEARWRPVSEEESHPERSYWCLASQAGRRVAVLDPPHAAYQPGLNGIQILDLASHDRSRGFGLRLDPPDLLERFDLRREDFPIWDSDAHPQGEDGHRRLLAGLRGELRGLQRLQRGLLERESWDLFFCAFGALHSSCHLLWHVLDARHPRHDPASQLAADFEQLASEIDSVVGALIEGAGPEAQVLLVAASGMGPMVGGPQLLPEVLARLGMSSGGGSLLADGLRGLQEQVKARTPLRRVRGLQSVAERPWVRRFQEAIGGMVFPLQSPRTRACAIPNNRIGAIRLNVRGREPHGRIAPGAETEAVVAELTGELLALEHLDSPEPIVAEVVRAEKAFGSGHHPGLPDLIVRFRRDLGQLDGCRSPRIGVLRARADHTRNPRTGDHTGHSRLWLRAPGVPAGGELPRANVVDIAPTVLDLLDVPLPDDLDGRSLVAQ